MTPACFFFGDGPDNFSQTLPPSTSFNTPQNFWSRRITALRAGTRCLLSAQDLLAPLLRRKVPTICVTHGPVVLCGGNKKGNGGPKKRPEFKLLSLQTFWKALSSVGCWQLSGSVGKWEMVSQAVSQACGHMNCGGSYCACMYWLERINTDNGVAFVHTLLLWVKTLILQLEES